MIELTNDPIDVAAVLEVAKSPNAGAVVLFLGTVRGVTGDKHTEFLEYECHPEMAKSQLAELVGEAEAKWPLTGCVVVHRLGRQDVGETTVAIAVSSPHRKEAFQAGEWLIDRIKEVVPIWKKENYTNGTSDWVHPGE